MVIVDAGHKRKLFISVLITLIVSFISFVDICSGTLHQHLSTKTAYEAYFTAEQRETRDEKVNSIPQTCQTQYLDITLRHGTRNPGKKDIVAIDKLFTRISEEIPHLKDDLDIEYWSNRFSVDEEKRITETGRDEHFNIAQRFGEKFKALLRNKSESHIAFISSDTNRTVESCHAFQRGLARLGVNVTKHCKIDNERLRFYEVCKRYLKLVDEGELKKEHQDFKNSDEIKDAILSFKRRHEIPEWFDISPG